jgi:hypothetical protein
MGYALALAAAAVVNLPASARAQGAFEGMAAGTMTMGDGKVIPFRYYQSGGRDATGIFLRRPLGRDDLRRCLR